MTESRPWRELNCIIKVHALMIFKGFVNDDDDLPKLRCDGPTCAQFHPNFKGCSFRK